ncbi:hypothetical protein BBB03_01080 [Candidatus Portiera aleyrodidarum]|nr:hypothetical protein BBB03_01080 [Candidatus Portiera aleyrodidarum]
MEISSMLNFFTHKPQNKKSTKRHNEQSTKPQHKLLIINKNKINIIAKTKIENKIYNIYHTTVTKLIPLKK